MTLTIFTAEKGSLDHQTGKSAIVKTDRQQADQIKGWESEKRTNENALEFKRRIEEIPDREIDVQYEIKPLADSRAQSNEKPLVVEK